MKWTSPVDLSSPVFNFSIVAVDESGSKHQAFFANHRSPYDERKEKRFQKELNKLQPFSVYRVHILAVKNSFWSDTLTEKSNEMSIRTLEGGMLSLQLFLYDGAYFCEPLTMLIKKFSDA